MIILVALAVFALVAARLSSRLTLVEQQVAALAGRVRTLERARPLADHVTPDNRPAPAVVTAPLHRAPSSAAPARPEPSRPAVKPAVRPGGGTATSRDTHESLETRIGSRWLLYVGVVAIFVGAAYFEKLAIDHGWIGEAARVIQGGVAGLVMVAAGRRLIARGLDLYGQMLAGCGIAVMYVAVFAAFNFYHLIGHVSAVALMSTVTALAARLADREKSQGLALLAVGGGFATPFLVPTVADVQFAWFVYASVLIAGTMVLANRRDWPVLNIVSYGGTLLTVADWSVRFYDPARYVPTEFFLTLFCVMFVSIAHAARRRTTPWTAMVRGVLWTAPACYYAASLLNLRTHDVALLVYLVALSLAGALIAARWNPHPRAAEVRLVFWLAAMLPLLVWTDGHASRAWLVAGMATVGGVYLTHLIAHLGATSSRDRRLTGVEIAMVHANGLVTFLAAYLLTTAVRDSLSGALAAACAVWHGAIALSLARHQREHGLHFGVLAASLLAMAVGLQFDGAWVTIGWAAEAALLVWLALAFNTPWLRVGALVLFAVAIRRLIDLQLQEPTIGELVLLNARGICGLFLVAASYWLAWVHQRFASAERRDVEVGVALVVAKLLLLAVATSEVHAYAIARGASYSVWMTREALVSISWAAVGTSLVRLGLGRGQSWMRGIGGIVLGVALVNLLRLEAALPARGYIVFLNVRMVASALVIATVLALAAFYRRTDSTDAGWHPRASLILAAHVLALVFLTSEIAAYWHLWQLDREVRGQLGDGMFARQMMTTIAWVGYATALIVAGIRRRYAPIRYLAIAVFGVSIVKVVLVDLARLDQFYRVSSIVALGVTLLVTSYLYHRQRDRLAASGQNSPRTDP